MVRGITHTEDEIVLTVDDTFSLDVGLDFVVVALWFGGLFGG